MADKPDMAILAALAEHTAALNRNTEASNRSAEASNHLSVKVDRLSQELDAIRGRVETIEDANHIEEEVLKRLESHREQQQQEPKVFLDVFKNPFLIGFMFLCFIALLAFAIARDPSTAGRVVDKVPTRELAK